MKKIWKLIKQGAKRISTSIISGIGMVIITCVCILATIVIPIVVLFSNRWQKDLTNFYYENE